MSPDDKYTYPGSGGVLRNYLGITDQELLDAYLNRYASAAWAALHRRPQPEPPELEYLQTIHRSLFAAVLPFAGQLRDVDAAAGGTGITYCRPEFIVPALADLSQKLAAEDYLRGLSQDQFTERLAERWGELSAIHPFRDGNTRAQACYVSRIAARAGHPIDWTRINVEALRHARIVAIAGTHRPLAECLRSAVGYRPLRAVDDALHPFTAPSARAAAEHPATPPHDQPRDPDR